MSLVRNLYLTIILLYIIPILSNAQDSTLISISCQLCEHQYQKSIPKGIISKYDAEREINLLLIQLQLDGFFETKVDSLKNDENNLHLTVTPGTKYLWEKLDTKGIPEELIKISGNEKNDFENRGFDLIKLQNLIEKIVDFSENNGYPFASIGFNNATINQNKIKADLVFHPGPMITFDSIKSSLPEKIKSSFLAAYLNILPGLPFDQRMVDQVEKKLSGLPYINYKSHHLTFQNEEATLHLELEPVEANQFEGILGLSPKNNQKGTILTGQVDLLLTNLLRSGKTFGFNWRQLKPASQYLHILYVHPRLFSSPLDGFINFDLLKEDSTFLNRNISFAIGYDFNAHSKLQFISEYRFSNTIYQSENELPDTKWFSYGTMFQWNNTDQLIFPTKGSSFEIKALIGNKKSQVEDISSSSIQFLLASSLENYIPFSKKLIIYNNISTGYLTSKNIYQNDLFQIGGFNDLRGFSENEFFAKKYLVSNLEVRYLIEEKSYLLAFYDQGFLDLPSLGSSTFTKPLGFGLGINLKVKPGVLKILYAIGSEWNESIDFNSSKLHFGFQTIF